MQNPKAFCIISLLFNAFAKGFIMYDKQSWYFFAIYNNYTEFIGLEKLQLCTTIWTQLLSKPLLWSWDSLISVTLQHFKVIKQAFRSVIPHVHGNSLFCPLETSDWPVCQGCWSSIPRTAWWSTSNSWWSDAACYTASPSWRPK